MKKIFLLFILNLLIKAYDIGNKWSISGVLLNKICISYINITILI